MPTLAQPHRAAALASASALVVLAACATGPGSALQTLDGKPPLVAAHRGASGYLPEETIEAYTPARSSSAPTTSSST